MDLPPPHPPPHPPGSLLTPNFHRSLEEMAAGQQNIAQTKETTERETQEKMMETGALTDGSRTRMGRSWRTIHVGVY